MGWKDYAIPVDEPQKPQQKSGSWKDYAIPVEEPKQDRSWYDFDLKNALSVDAVKEGAKNIGSGLLKAAEWADEHTGAPVRKKITEFATGEKMDHAPTGSEQAKMIMDKLGRPDLSYKETLGLPENFGGNLKPSDVYGVGLEVVQDPLLIGGKAIQGIRKGAKSLGLIKPVEEAGLVKKSLEADQAGSAMMRGEVNAKNSASISGGDLEINQSGKAFEFKEPKSLDEIRNWKPSTNVGAMPQKSRLAEIVRQVPDLETKPLKYHFDMLENPKAMKQLKIDFENLPTEDAKKIAQYNQEIVNESARKIESTAHSLSNPEVGPRSLSDMGNDFIESTKNKYKGEKDLLGPVFEDMKNSPPLNPIESKDLIIGIAENSKLKNALQVDEQSGKLFLGKHSPKSGVSEEEHRILSKVVDSLNDGATFKEIQDIRDYLRKAIDPANPKATEELGRVRKIMLDHLTDMSTRGSEVTREKFRAYAINETARENIETIIGGKIESLDKMYAANPDKVVSKIFSNPNHTDIVKGYLGEDKVNEMLSSFITDGFDKANSGTKGFQPHVFQNWLKKNNNILEKNLDPNVYNKLNALADYGYFGKRFLDEVNPSGTAASLKGMLEPGGFINSVKQKGIIGGVTSEVATKIQGRAKQKQAIKNIERALGNEPAPKGPMSDRLDTMGAKASDKAMDLYKYQGPAAVTRGLLKKKEEKKKGLLNE